MWPRRATVPNFSWLTEKIAAALRQVKRAGDRYRTTRATEDKNKIHEARTQKRNILKKGRKQGWRTYVDDRSDF